MSIVNIPLKTGLKLDGDGKPLPVPEVVEVLSALLEKAKCGQVQAFAMAYIGVDDSRAYWPAESMINANHYDYYLISSLSVLLHRMTKVAAEGGSLGSVG